MYKIFFNLKTWPTGIGSKYSQQSGFTIVELLIVIVVIGILAAISIVAYNGIQDRANDTTVQSDLRNFGNKIHEYYALESTYPGGTAHFTTQTDLSGMNFSVSKNAYATNTHNFIYVKNNAPGAEEFIVVARSKSNKRYSFSSSSGVKEYTGTWGAVANVCSNQGWTICHISYGFNSSNSSWGAWTQ